MKCRLIVQTLLLVTLVLSGCQTRPVAREAYRPDYEPVNTIAHEVIPAHVRRVAALPLYWRDDGRAEFLHDMDRQFQLALGQSRSFEVVPVSRDRLQALVGKEQAGSVELLPASFLRKIREETGADAVLFSDLTVSELYRPIALGVRAKLLDLETGQIIWAIDAVFDSADPEVAYAAREFASRATYNPYPFDPAGGILQSPRRFTDFVAYCVFRTLPPRI